MIYRLLGAFLILSAGASSVAAGCPGEKDNGKRVTVRGTVNYVGQDADGGYGFGIEECDVYIMSSQNGGGACKAGSKLSATGKFFSCEAHFLGGCDPDLGDPDWMEGAKVTCK